MMLFFRDFEQVVCRSSKPIRLGLLAFEEVLLHNDIEIFVARLSLFLLYVDRLFDRFFQIQFRNFVWKEEIDLLQLLACRYS